MKKLTVLILLILIYTTCLAQNPGSTGSFGLFHTHDSRVFNPGRFDLSTNTNFFTKVGEAIGQTSSDFDAVNWWLVASNLSFTYGIFNHLDATFSIRLYQDTHHNNEFNLPGDLFFTLKTGSYLFGRNRLGAGFLASARIPTGEVHNYPFAEYASGALEYGFSGVLSYFSDPYFPDRSFHMHYNIGWWNHNEKGEAIPLPKGEDRIATVNSSNLQMALAGVLPLGIFDFRLELAGILNTSDPDPFIYSAEEWVYLTPSIRFKAYDWISMDLGVDIRVSPEDRQRTRGVPDVSQDLDLPKNYPPWKVQLGVNISLLPSKKKENLIDLQDEAFQRSIRLYELIQREQEKAKDVEKEIDKLRKDRQAADEEIEKIKKALEEQ